MSEFTASRRINALFDTFHTADEAETTSATVVDYVIGQGYELTVEDLEQLRAGITGCKINSDVLGAIVDYFRFPLDYLTTSEHGQRFRDLQEQLDTLRVLRHQGVKRVRFRGQPTSSDRAALVRALRT
ncbi:hypothetical protein [Rhodococcoides yunnanense]|uniref:hypothetical protein n=1 Tax=Rhodococcoides yunnanense TaxID=278209 RepID=UPI0022B18A31|nr:hypothetical protein [Rhodococcus yunnanensis]MCZ4277392.1 hypothetical protein [Rhodococcus yunnanensis]